MLVAAHPDGGGDAAGSGRRTRAFAHDPGLRELVHRFELFNRERVFPWVADAGLPAVASGDFHDLSHLGGWRTLLPCSRDPAAVIDYLRSPRPVFLARLGAAGTRLAA